ncbi:integrase family protein [Paramagnetospirillum caucaseum]|uniref:Integrase family protein n=1 Tax=Paramagnetospirillum caucaseum TaxID=1244869 RepID=M3AD48_9PROT|nr:site-specific integrase [Paramagnetospirillum caucaseum]EME70693.1 integrase family protein [Paramagnetospirillum caucaseum]
MANIRKRGDSWQAKVQRKGMPVLYQTFAKKSDAAVWARQIEASIDRGETPDEVGPMATTTFGELIARYQAEVTVTKRSARQENYRMKRFLAHPMSKLHLKDLTTGVFAGYRNERSKSCGPQQVRHELNLMGHIIRTATIDWDFPFGKNPVDLIRKPKIPPGRTRRLIPGELEKMREGMEKSESTYLIPMIEFAIETAMRRGEILGLEWRNFNFRTNTVLLPMTKNGHPRTVPLSSKAMDIIRSRFGLDDKRVFAVTETAVRLAFDRLMDRIRIDDLHFHDLRHEAITRLFERGLTVPEVALISGHREYRMLTRYTHISPEELVKKLG